MYCACAGWVRLSTVPRHHTCADRLVHTGSTKLPSVSIRTFWPENTKSYELSRAQCPRFRTAITAGVGRRAYHSCGRGDARPRVRRVVPIEVLPRHVLSLKRAAARASDQRKAVIMLSKAFLSNPKHVVAYTRMSQHSTEVWLWRTRRALQLPWGYWWGAT